MTPALTYGSVCSGIEAATVAWHPLGWKASWFAEIEPFPSAVLAHRYPEVPNLGDMTKIAVSVLRGEVSAPDVLVGGTPCQAFSVAGLRESLADERGNLTLRYVELANAIDHVRAAAGEQPTVIVWENVPGVLSTKDNAFGCFLAGLAGEDEPLQPPGGKWSNAGAVYGPRRAVAWRTMDAQYFGVAQRRRRVFVVASARTGFDPATVLFEWDGVRRDFAPSREAGKDATAGTIQSTDGGSDVDHARARHLRAVASTIEASFSQLQGCSGQDANHGHGHLITAFGGNRTSGSIEVTPALLAQPGSGWKGDFESETFLVQPTHTLRGEGFDASEDGTGRGTPLVPVTTPTLTSNGDAHSGFRDEHGLVPLAFDTTQITSAANRSNPQPGDPSHPLAAGAHASAIAFPANLSGTQCASAENLAPSMGAKNPTAVAHSVRLANTSSNGWGIQEEVTHTLDCTAGPAVQTAMQVRRLTPRECERLQAFPDDYTLIPWRKKPASECPDGPRYKALGNSMCVFNMRWIGRRIDAALRRVAA